MCLSDYVADSPNSSVLLNSLSLLQAKKFPAGPLTKKKSQKIALLPIPPKFGPQEYLANYLPSSSPRGVLSFT